jgi:cellulose synthase/poly-beta-1,6-N-acetylglucosamine synthase-like glycosyltransferase
MGRLAWSELGALTVISGAFGLFRRDRVLEVGGYTVGTVGEDLELVMKLHRRNHQEKRDYKIVFAPDPVCWTQAPERLDVLGRQRSRWQRGALEVFARHEDMLLNPNYGRIGLLAMPYMLLVDVLGPLAEVGGYTMIPVFWCWGLLSFNFFAAFLSLSICFGIVISVGGLALEEMRFRRFPSVSSLAALLVAAVLENFGYRQATNVWRVIGMWHYLRGATQWGVMTRRGFQSA